MLTNRKRSRVLALLPLFALRRRNATPYRLTEKEQSAGLTTALIRLHRRTLLRHRPRAPRSAAAELTRSSFTERLCRLLFHPASFFRPRNKKRGFLAHFLRRRQLSPLLPEDFYDTEPEPLENKES